MKRIYLLLFCCQLFQYDIAFAEKYKTITNDGKIIYTDSKISSKSTTLKGEIEPIVLDSAASIRAKERKDSLLRAEQDKKEKLLAEERKINFEKLRKEKCDKAKNNIKILETDAPILNENASGEKRILNDEERKKQHSENINFIKEFCKK